MNPILGIIALFAFIGCSRRDERDSPLKAASCPKDWEEHSIATEQGEIHLCHQDGNNDGVYQKDGDKLTLKVGDRFIPAENKDFPNFQQKFRLPNFEGLRLKNYFGAHRKMFSQGVSSGDAVRFQSLQNYFQEKNLSMNGALDVAEKIPWLDGRSRPATWRDIGPEEKMDATALVGILMGIQQEKEGFYPSNRDFIDTVLKKMGEGRLKLQKLAKLEGKTNHALTDLLGPDRTMGYNREKNLLMLGLPLDPSSSVSSSNCLHELFHFYQDATKFTSNFLEVEFSAYAKQGEFIVRSLSTPSLQKKYQGVEDYLKKEYPHKDTTLDHPVAWGIRYAEALLAQQDPILAKAEEALVELIHRYYYFRVYLSKNAVEPGMKAAALANRMLAGIQEEEKIRAEMEAKVKKPVEPRKTLQESLEDMLNDKYTEPPPSPVPSNWGQARKNFNAEIRKSRELEKTDTQELEKSLEAVKRIDANRLNDSQVGELVQRFNEVLLAATYRIELETYELYMKFGDLEPITRIEINLDGPKYRDLYQGLSKYQPLKFQATVMDGVD